MKILVAEDHEAMRRLVYRILTRMGHQVELAKDGNELIELWKLGRHRMVISDLEMPGKNGLDACREIKNMNPKVKIILMTGLPYADKRAAEMGIGPCITKDNIVKELEKVVPPPDWP